MNFYSFEFRNYLRQLKDRFKNCIIILHNTTQIVHKIFCSILHQPVRLLCAKWLEQRDQPRKSVICFFVCFSLCSKKRIQMVLYFWSNYTSVITTIDIAHTLHGSFLSSFISATKFFHIQLHSCFFKTYFDTLLFDHNRFQTRKIYRLRFIKRQTLLSIYITENQIPYRR